MAANTRKNENGISARRGASLLHEPLQQLDALLLLGRVVLASKHLCVGQHNERQLQAAHARVLRARTSGVLPCRSFTLMSAPAVKICTQRVLSQSAAHVLPCCLHPPAQHTSSILGRSASAAAKSRMISIAGMLAARSVCGEVRCAACACGRAAARTVQQRVHAVVCALHSQAAHVVEVLLNVVAARKGARRAMSLRHRSAHSLTQCSLSGAACGVRRVPVKVVAALAADDACATGRAGGREQGGRYSATRAGSWMACSAHGGTRAHAARSAQRAAQRPHPRSWSPGGT